MISKIAKAVEDASANKPHIDRFISRFAKIYTPIVIVAAVLTAVIPSLITGQWTKWIHSALTFLVISCPCALGLATPVAIMVGSGVGAKKGLLFKTSAVLEEAGKIKTVALDKTGTITKGEMYVTGIFVNAGKSEKELLSLALTLEKQSEHPLAKAIVRKCNEENISGYKIEEFKALSGNGVSGKISGEDVSGGNLRFISRNINVPNEIFLKAESIAENGQTPLVFAKGNEVYGIIAVSDLIKEDSKETIKELKKLGIHTVMLTGDNKKTAKAIAEEVGIDEVFSDVLPDGKEEVIRKLIEEKGKYYQLYTGNKIGA
jgi:Cu2+-exporting ATPase